MRHKLLLKALALGLALLAATAISVAAQTTSGSLSGRVNDAQGAAISGARVEVTSTSRNETRTAQTGEDGRYDFPQLQPDTYKLRVEARGFKRYDLEGLVLSPNDNALNHTQFSGVNSNLNFTSLTNLTPTNLAYDANGNFVFNNRNGFGTVSGVRDPRILQMVARFVF